MKTSYTTTIIGDGNHASIEIPEEQLETIGGNKRAPLKITINDHTYQSTATGVNGKCMVVFPMRDREAAGVSAGDSINVTIELDSGYRNVDVPEQLVAALEADGLSKTFRDLTYSKRKEYARVIREAKTAETLQRRLAKIISELKDR